MSGTYTAEHARSGAANLQVVLADLGSVEHGVEGGDFVDLHGGHLEDLGGLVHGREGQEVVVLLLCNEQDGDDCGRLVVVGVLGQELLNGSVALSRELEGRLLQVVLRVAMVRKRAKAKSLRRSGHHGQGAACHGGSAGAKREEAVR